jgi:organic radical activating enzyme
MSEQPMQYHDFVKHTRDKLNKVGHGFCMAKWYHVSMHLHIGKNHSCYHPTPHKMSVEEIAVNPGALHNTKQKKLQRKTMLEGGRPSECSYCWAIEDLKGDNISDRHLRSSEYWAYDKIEETSKLDWDADVYPSYLELNFGNECQLKCSYCAPMASSSWFNETAKFGNWPLENRVNVGQYDIQSYLPEGAMYKREEGNPYIEAFWKWFPEVYPHLHTLRFTGGEPLLSSNVFKVIDYIKENPRPDLQFNINSNMMVPMRNLSKFCLTVKDLVDNNKIKAVKIYTSVDTWGPQAEWIRNGLNLEKFSENIDYLMETVPNPKFGFMITFCLLAIPQFDKLLDKILELRRKYNVNIQEGQLHYEQPVNFDTPYTIEPPHLTARIADDWMVEKLQSHLKYMHTLVDDNDVNKFSTMEYLKFKRVVEWVETSRYEGEELAINRRDFARFVDEHDRRRGTDWHAAFPELLDFYNMCKDS